MSNLSINAAAKRMGQPYLLVSGFVYGMQLPLQQDGKNNLMTEDGYQELKDMMENHRYDNVTAQTEPKPKYKYKKKVQPESTVSSLNPEEKKAPAVVAVGEDSGARPGEVIPAAKAAKAAPKKAIRSVLDQTRASGLFSPGGEAGPKQSLARTNVKKASKTKK